MEFTIKELTLNDLHPNLLQHFSRHQEVKRCWRMEGDKWVLKDVVFDEEWDENLKKEIVENDLANCLKAGGFVWGVFGKNNGLVAFASLSSEVFGSQNQYLQLVQLHVSSEYRGKGIGKALFNASADKAKMLGAKKLYISAHSSEETCAFYKNLGCADAQEINKKLAKLEPYDRQMEFVI